MSDPILVRPRHHYDSYNDLWELVRLSDFPTCYIDELDPHSDHLYILPTRNGEVGEGWPDATARIIHWNLEWDIYPDLPGVSEVWHSDRWFAQHSGAKHVPMGSHPGLKPSDLEYVPDIAYDVAFLGYMIPRRQQVWTWMKERNLRVTTNGAWGADRHRLLMGSAIYGHIHQHEDKPGLPPLRLVVAAAYSLPFISETVADQEQLGYTYFMQADYAHFAEFVQMWTHDINRTRLQDYGAALHDRLCRDLTFRRSVERAV